MALWGVKVRSAQSLPASRAAMACAPCQHDAAVLLSCWVMSHTLFLTHRAGGGAWTGMLCRQRCGHPLCTHNGSCDSPGSCSRVGQRHR